MERMVLASANPEKVAELRALLDGQVDLVARPPEVPDVVEDADTFLGNAQLKAAALLTATGLASVADDSGLEVDALDGAPGVWSARYAGEGATDEANVEKLLAALADRSDPALRRARFRCVIVLRRPDGSEVVADGTAEGHIASAPRGAGGFGYDPIFVAQGYDVTTAEITAAQKNAVSHRGHAFTAMAADLAAL